ncbi:hypothetical protein RhiLY_07596 [Ceratobasidium sp. AG-Ba]|nr:hypothetical protein RhiLY_07596 [Ceratobasidium sp. AG-Ba]
MHFPSFISEETNLHGLHDPVLAGLRRFKQSGELVHLDQNIALLESTISSVSPHDAEMCRWLMNLSDLHYLRFEKLHKTSDLDNAITHLEQAMAMDSSVIRDLEQQLSNLSLLYIIRFRHTNNPDCIAKAIVWLKEAVANPCHDKRTVERIPALNNLSGLYATQFGISKSLVDINNAIETQTQATKMALDADICHPAWMENLAMLQYCRFKHTMDLAHLHQAIASQTTTVQLTNPENADLPNRISDLAELHTLRFKHTATPTDIDQVIKLYDRAISCTRASDEKLLVRQSELSSAYDLRFKTGGKILDLNCAIELQSGVVRSTPDYHPKKLGRLDTLVNLYRQKFAVTDDPIDITQAIGFQQEGAELISKCTKFGPRWLNLLGILYCTKYECIGNLEDIDSAIKWQLKAIGVAGENHDDQLVLQSGLSRSYMRRFKHLGRREDIEYAIGGLRDTTLTAPNGHTAKPDALNMLGMTYAARFNYFGDLADIDEAIILQTEAVKLSTIGSRVDHMNLLNNVASSHHLRFERTGVIDDIEQSISYLSQGASISTNNRADRAFTLSSLGSAYMRRFERLGDLPDIEKAIEYGSTAVSMTSDSHSLKPLRLSNLGFSYMTRFRFQGEIGDIDQAVSLHTLAVQLTPQDHISKPARLSNLAAAYACRFRRLDELVDIDKAVDYDLQAIALNQGEYRMPELLSNLGVAYISRFKRLAGKRDIEGAVAHLTKAVDLAADDHIAKPRWLNSLARSHQFQFECFKDTTALDRAISIQYTATNLIPHDHPESHVIVNNLSALHRQRFEKSRNDSDLDKAIVHGMKALSKEGPDSGRCARLFNLGLAYGCRFQQSNDIKDLEKVLNVLHEAYGISEAPPSIRLEVAWTMAKYLRVHRSASAALPAWGRFIDLLPRVLWLGNTISHRYRDIAEFGKAIGEATLDAIESGRFDLALEWAEEGRSVVWKQILQLRTPVDELSRVAPELARSLRVIGRDLELAGSQELHETHMMDLPHSQQSGQRLRNLAEQWDDVVRRVRAVPGYHEFLNPMKASSMTKAAHSGPVIVVYLHENRCGVLPIMPNSDTTTHIPLPAFSLALAAKVHEVLLETLNKVEVDNRQARKPAFRPAEADVVLDDILETLWFCVVKPILDSIGYRRHETTSYELKDMTYDAQARRNHSGESGRVGQGHIWTRSDIQACEAAQVKQIERHELVAEVVVSPKAGAVVVHDHPPTIFKSPSNPE